MVKEIKPNGRLKLTKIGGFAWNTVEGEGCTVFASRGETVRGSLLLTKASSHVHGAQVNELKRDDDNMEVRLDARTTIGDRDASPWASRWAISWLSTRALEITNGFVRSRHLDDKACVACLLAAVKALHDAGLQPGSDYCCTSATTKRWVTALPPASRRM